MCVADTFATVTNVLFATPFAIIGATLCTCSRLELLSSSRRLRFDTKSKRTQTVVDVIFCIILPLFYVALRE
jgi:hypothetical protein